MLARGRGRNCDGVFEMMLKRGERFCSNSERAFGELLSEIGLAATAGVAIESNDQKPRRLSAAKKAARVVAITIQHWPKDVGSPEKRSRPRPTRDRLRAR